MMKNRIKELRIKKKLTVQRLAELSGTTHPQILRLESGERKLTLEWMERLAKSLECRSIDLISEDSAVATIDSPHPLNREMLLAVMDGLESFLHAENISVSTEERSKIIAIIYNQAVFDKQTELKEGDLKKGISLVLSAMKNN